MHTFYIYLQFQKVKLLVTLESRDVNGKEKLDLQLQSICINPSFTITIKHSISAYAGFTWKLGRGGVLGQGKGSGLWVKKRFMGKEAVNGNISDYWVWKRLMSQLCWQHAKIIFPNKNPPERSKGAINVNS